MHPYLNAIKEENKYLTAHKGFNSVIVQNLPDGGLEITFVKSFGKKNVSAKMTVKDTDETVEDFIQIYRKYADNAERMMNRRIKTA